MLKSSKLAKLRNQKIQRKYIRKHLFTVGGGYDSTGTEVVEYKIVPEGEANLISSKTDDGFHAPVLDLDFNCDLIPSLTEGHFHLYLDKRLTWKQYQKLLKVMVDVGLVEKNWVQSGAKAECTMVRKPSLAIQDLFVGETEDEE